MVTGELKSKIDSLWEIFWTGGLTNPLDVIEQMTYLMFIHDLDESDNTHAKEAAMLGLPYKSIFAGEVQVGERTVDSAQLKWSVFHDFRQAKCTPPCRRWCSPSSRICTATRTVPTPSTWVSHFQSAHAADAG